MAYTRFRSAVVAGEGFFVGAKGSEVSAITATRAVAASSLSVTGATILSSVTGPGAGGNVAAGTYTIRVRVPIATVNGGYNLLNAQTGLKFRLVDVYLIAVGGAATSTNATHLEVRGTQGAGAVVLFKVAKAQLTQSAVNRIGTASTVVLADGASFANCDVNTGITLNPLGGVDFATATDIDVVLTYAVEA